MRPGQILPCLNRLTLLPAGRMPMSPSGAKTTARNAGVQNPTERQPKRTLAVGTGSTTAIRTPTMSDEMMDGDKRIGDSKRRKRRRRMISSTTSSKPEHGVPVCLARPRPRGLRRRGGPDVSAQCVARSGSVICGSDGLTNLGDEISRYMYNMFLVIYPRCDT